MTEPTWLAEARLSIGQRETLGSNDSPWIRKILASMGGMWMLGQPWCGAVMAHWMRAYNPPKHWYRAKAWLDWGDPISAPVVGCVVVLSRLGGAHVGQVVGRSLDGRLLVLGGNQRNAVNIMPFDGARVLGYRYPKGQPVPLSPMPMFAHSGETSSNEA